MEVVFVGKIIVLFLGLFIIYAVIPTILARVFGMGVRKKANAENQFTLTFDDGPDPVYTPALLELLKLYEVKATFFVLGEKAEKYPALIRYMHQEGHLIAIHHYTHTANWLLSPLQLRNRINRTAAIIEEIIGVRPAFYRPPWGLVTLADLGFRKQYQIILWSLMVGDWRGERKQKQLKKKLIKRVTQGSIIVLHDSGETFGAMTDAPKYMLDALHLFLQEVESKGYTCVRMDNLLG
ncbi:MAG TPA: polysaccharide deacetylase family protein [Bacillales bacterium]